MSPRLNQKLLVPTAIPASPEDRDICYREEWLSLVALEVVSPLFKGACKKLDPFKVTCGWPSRMGTAAKRRVVGECHSLETSKAMNAEIFISPLLDDSVEVSGVLTHEVAHVVAGHLAQHGPKFQKLCRYVGLTKNKPTSAMPAEMLEERLRKEIGKYGPYPHAAIQLVRAPVKPSSTVRLDCPACGCNLRMTMKWTEKSGYPTCGCGSPMEIHEDESE